LDAVHILVVTPIPPWPTVTGAQMRLANVVAGLSRLGRVDLFVLLGRSTRDVVSVPPGAPVQRVGAAYRPWRRWNWPVRAAWALRGDVPLELAGRDYRDVRTRFRQWAVGRYDLVWAHRVESYHALGACFRAPVVVDFDDLEDHKIAARLRMRGAVGTARGVARVRQAGSWVQGVRNALCWRRLQQAVARAVDTVVVCSEVDRRRLGVGNAVVVPNGYSEPDAPAGRVDVGDPPVVTFVGFLPYAPNADAAVYLARAIGPRVRARIPDVQIRLVGYADGRIAALHDPPRVVVTGYVPEVVTELRRADALAVPVRFGGGTRIKVLEGFAHRIPVVSTTAGAEGIEARDGVEILLRDTPEAFAQGCVALLRDLRLRQALTDAAHALFMARYRWEQVQDTVTAVASSVVTGHGGRVAVPG
jgi:glycosyltransferase involved in cell wall biosynthesis